MVNCNNLSLLGEVDSRCREELDVDIKDIVYKIRCVLLPFRIDREVLLASPDFWGPMIVVFLYGMLLVWGQVCTLCFRARTASHSGHGASPVPSDELGVYCVAIWLVYGLRIDTSTWSRSELLSNGGCGGLLPPPRGSGGCGALLCVISQFAGVGPAG